MIDNHRINEQQALVNYPPLLLKAVATLSDAMPQTLPAVQRRWLALQMLEGDIYSHRLAGPAVALLPAAIQALQQQQQEDPALVIADARYQSIATLSDAVSNSQQAMPNRLTDMLDKVILNRWLGVPIFLLVMYLMFLLAINIGGALQPIFDIGSAAIFIQGIQWLGYTLHFPDWLTVSWRRRRRRHQHRAAAGAADRHDVPVPVVPGRLRLHGACGVRDGSPDAGTRAAGQILCAADRRFRLQRAVHHGRPYAGRPTRAPDHHHDGAVHVLRCRLAIFAVFAAAFFGQDGAGVVFSLYMLGIAVAILTGLVLKYTLMRGEASPFVMELPVYHVPHLKSLLLQTWQRLKGFVLRAGKVIVVASIFIGGLNSFSFSGKTVDNINDSALATVSKVLTPLLQPMGVHRDNWQATVGLVTGAMAKEVVVGTLNTLYTAEHINKEAFDAANFNLLDELGGALQETWDGLKNTFSLSVLSNPIEASKGDGEMGVGSMGVMSSKFGSGISAYSYLIFVLLYVPCVSVMGAIARESSRGWMTFSILWGLNVAYSLATLFYQAATFNQHPQYSLTAILAVVLVNLLVLFGLRRARSRVTVRLGNATPAACCQGAKGSCH